VLDYIDDQFGPLSIDTVSQAVHFARVRTITNRRGFNDYVRPDRLREKLLFPILHLHGEQNGLVSVQTPEHFQKVLTQSDGRFESPRAFQPKLYNAGHQDLLIGRPAAAMFKELNAYLEEPFDRPNELQSETRVTFAARVPAYGVRLPAPIPQGNERCSLGDDGASGAPIAVLLVPVVNEKGRYVPADNWGRPLDCTPGSLGKNIQWRAAEPVVPSRQTTRFTFDLAGYVPGPGCGLLTLLLYNQSADIGAPPGVPDRSFLRLALHVASKAKGGRGLASLAGLLADPDGMALGGNAGAGDLIDTLVLEMVLSVQHVFQSVAATELGLAVLRPPPRRDRSAPPPSTRSFALASCQYPGGMLDRTPPGATRASRPGPSDASYLRLLAVLEGRRGTGAGDKRLPVPEFLVLTGDQIYADATAGLFDPRKLSDRHRVSYEAFFGALGSRAVLSRLSAVMRLDDHEIDDNWEPDPPEANPRDGTSTERLKERGIHAFLRNQCDRDPGALVPQRLWQDTTIDGLAFFWADARTERSARTAATVGSATLLGAEQSTALDKWLADKTIEGPRFLVSGPMVLPRHLETRRARVATSVRSDAWDGYPASLHHLLARVYESGTNDVVFLSGNEHVSNVATIRISKPGTSGVVIAHSIHSSALYAPYPFANGTKEDFAGAEEFDFPHQGVTYRCCVNTWYPLLGDGFALLSISAETSGWLVSVRFDRENQSPFDPANTSEFHIGSGAP
jgi:cholesterol oxidase